MPKRQTNRPSILITLATILIIPQLALAVEEGCAEAADANIRASHAPGGATCGIRDGETAA